MDANEYQRLATLTAAPQNDADRAANAVLGLAGEAGELAQLLLDGGHWRGSEQVRHALTVIATLGALVEPVKKVIYQGHVPPVLNTWVDSFDRLHSAANSWEHWCYDTSRAGGLVWEDLPATADLTAVERKFADELGDAQWYVSQGARAIGWDLGIVMQGNITKLERRFPGRVFSAEASQARAEPTADPFVGPRPTLPAITGLHFVPSLNGESVTLSWNDTGYPYAIELEGNGSMLFCGSGCSSGSWMRKSTPYRMRVRLQDGARFGPWSEPVTLPPAPLAAPEPPESPPSIALRISAVSGAGGPQWARTRVVSLVWEHDPLYPDGYTVELSDTPDFKRTAQVGIWPPLKSAAVNIGWEATPYIRVRAFNSELVSNSAPCPHLEVEVIGSIEVMGAQKLHCRCDECGAEVWVDPDDDRVVGWALPNIDAHQAAVRSFAEEAERMVEAQRRVRAAQNARTTAMHWIVTRDGKRLDATRRHETELAAIGEAERLARKDGATFLVWRMVGRVEPAESPVRWVPASDLPF